MVKPLLVWGAILLGCMPLEACKRAPQGRMLNESLRLTQDQIARDKRAAQAGDAEAAKRLWHHYDMVELNIQEGEMWRHRYESLTNTTPAGK